MKLKREYLTEIMDDWDKAFEKEFGPTNEVKIMSAKDTLKELQDMANFKFTKDIRNDSNHKNKPIQ